MCRLAFGDAWDTTGIGIPGLNLTQSVLDGIVKYPWPVDGNGAKPAKWGFYREESDHFAWAHEGTPALRRSLIADVMDWSDDVTYAIHDLLDFYRAGLIPLEQVRAIPGTPGPNIERDAFLLRLFKRRHDWQVRRAEYEAALDSILDLFPFDPSHRYSGSESDEQLLYQFSTRLITKYVTAITPARTGGVLVSVQQNARDEVHVLKEFVWAYVILNPDLAVLQAGHRKAIRTVFKQFLLAAREGRVHFFPLGFRPRITDCKSNDALVRVVADYVAGMTERELIHTYRRLEATVN